MRALLLVEPGDPPKLEVHDVPLPAVGDREALVKVSACGLCYHDVLVMSGALRRGVKPQLILGHEISGEVVECGALVGTVAPGDRVASILTNACGACANCARGREHRCLLGVGIGHGADGGFAEYVTISEASLVKLPLGVDDAGACLFACPMGVALHALRDASELRAGETAVVTGAGGGLGVHAVQIARALGARVLAITSSQEKEAALRELQPDELIVAPDLDFGEIVQALTADAGADVVMNNLGAVAFEACWASMGQFGTNGAGGRADGRRRLAPARGAAVQGRTAHRGYGGIPGAASRRGGHGGGGPCKARRIADVPTRGGAGRIRAHAHEGQLREARANARGTFEQPRVGRGGGCPTPPRRPGFPVADATAMWGEGCGVATAGKLGVFWSARAPLDCSPSVD